MTLGHPAIFSGNSMYSCKPDFTVSSTLFRFLREHNLLGESWAVALLPLNLALDMMINLYKLKHQPVLSTVGTTLPATHDRCSVVVQSRTKTLGGAGKTLGWPALVFRGSLVSNRVDFDASKRSSSKEAV